MPIIACPECRQSVSDEAFNCPSCGYPLNKPKRSGMGAALGCLLAIPALFIVISIIGLLAAIGIPSFQKARANALRKAQEMTVGEPAETSSIQTEWLGGEEFDRLLAELGEKVDGKNYWDRGHWIDSVDGRLEDGQVQYTISYSAVPPSSAYWWYWWFNQDQASFNNHLERLTEDGFTLVHFQSFENAEGELRFQGVWHKIVN